MPCLLWNCKSKSTLFSLSCIWPWYFYYSNREVANTFRSFPLFFLKWKLNYSRWYTEYFIYSYASKDTPETEHNKNGFWTQNGHSYICCNSFPKWSFKNSYNLLNSIIIGTWNQFLIILLPALWWSQMKYDTKMIHHIRIISDSLEASSNPFPLSPCVELSHLVADLMGNKLPQKRLSTQERWLCLKREGLHYQTAQAIP